jgi:hypothetical protein
MFPFPRPTNKRVPSFNPSGASMQEVATLNMRSIQLIVVINPRYLYMA